MRIDARDCDAAALSGQSRGLFRHRDTRDRRSGLSPDGGGRSRRRRAVRRSPREIARDDAVRHQTTRDLAASSCERHRDRAGAHRHDRAAAPIGERQIHRSPRLQYRFKERRFDHEKHKTHEKLQINSWTFSLSNSLSFSILFSCILCFWWSNLLFKQTPIRGTLLECTQVRIRLVRPVAPGPISPLEIPGRARDATRPPAKARAPAIRRGAPRCAVN